MPEWMTWMALIWVFFAIRGRHGCGWHGARRRVHGRASGRIGRAPGGQHGDDFAFGTPGRPVQIGTHPDARGLRARNAPHADRRRRSTQGPTKPPETAEQRLQRQFVEGRLTIEEYESKLWEEIGAR